jgi:hypothetical protein
MLFLTLIVSLPSRKKEALRLLILQQKRKIKDIQFKNRSVPL